MCLVWQSDYLHHILVPQYKEEGLSSLVSQPNYHREHSIKSPTYKNTVFKYSIYQSTHFGREIPKNMIYNIYSSCVKSYIVYNNIELFVCLKYE